MHACSVFRAALRFFLDAVYHGQCQTSLDDCRQYNGICLVSEMRRKSLTLKLEADMNER
jgi:hypothetical protein